MLPDGWGGGVGGGCCLGPYLGGEGPSPRAGGARQVGSPCPGPSGHGGRLEEVGVVTGSVPPAQGALRSWRLRGDCEAVASASGSCLNTCPVGRRAASRWTRCWSSTQEAQGWASALVCSHQGLLMPLGSPYGLVCPTTQRLTCSGMPASHLCHQLCDQGRGGAGGAAVQLQQLFCPARPSPGRMVSSPGLQKPGLCQAGPSTGEDLE